ncbi:hypothetical protein LTR37_017558 [Vermiconidia calcicola]|uniref:Uncharacterized protein n=1 Tax=Vermiconidia calcicola TaxID=1690605 RepID=A0ACC3MKI5_9PEZI|nr:hypothetical protein LTR37_017558 [Vermiconidia calcicola]
MAQQAPPSNPLITNKASEAALNVQVHPLVLLTITDYVTRHISRQQKTAIVGAIIGQQNGRNFTLEHAYECKTSLQGDGSVAIDAEWFADRLEQYKDVHKAPALDLVAMFMLGSVEGPAAEHAQLMKRVQEVTASDPAMLLLFHAEMVDQLQGGKLPITLYESVQEQDGGEAETKFRELSFEVETGEAEMIGVDFVATGAGNAMAVPKVEAGGAGEGSSKEKDKRTKGKGKAKDGEDAETNGAASHILSAEDEELIAALTAKANAIKMLNQRINLIRSYLKTLPDSYLTDSTSTAAPPETTNHTLLRSINAMLSRLPLLAPSTTSTPTPQEPTAASKEKQDVHLTSLLASLTRSVSEAQSMGAKFHVMSREKQNKERNTPFGARGGGGRYGGDESILAGESGGF